MAAKQEQSFLAAGNARHIISKLVHIPSYYLYVSQFANKSGKCVKSAANFGSMGLLLPFDKGFYDSWRLNCNRSDRVLAPNILMRVPNWDITSLWEGVRLPWECFFWCWPAHLT